jgi:flavin-dependent dehydrogenase
VTRSVDVAILGGGLAANFLARLLRRQSNHLSVAMFERDVERSYKVGESTVEIASNFMTRRLGLSRYLYEQHLPKNGLRFFFDNESRNAELHEMSEIGVPGLPPYPSFQLDRARIERDLLEMNRADGVDVYVPARVKDLSLDKTGGFHTFKVVEDGTETSWKARWVVDATGREGLIARHEDLRIVEPRHKLAGAWGRFTNITDMDDRPDREWHARVNFTARGLSTNHLCYPGYWIWFIPLNFGVTSVGIVMDKEVAKWDKSYHNAEGMIANIRAHRAADYLMEKAELIDHMAWATLPFRTRRFFGDHRWSVIGDAAAFVDPFYSPGSDFISLECELTADLIARDAAGESLEERIDAYDKFMHFRFEVCMLLYEHQYKTFGSYELLRAKVYFDTACYYNLWFDSFAKDEHLDLKAVQGILRRSEPVVQTMRNFRDLFGRTADTLRARGDYYKRNLGVGMHCPIDGFGPIKNVGSPRKRPDIDARTGEIFNRTAMLMQALLDGDEKRYMERPFYEFADEGAFSGWAGSPAQPLPTAQPSQSAP